MLLLHIKTGDRHSSHSLLPGGSPSLLAPQQEGGQGYSKLCLVVFLCNMLPLLRPYSAVIALKSPSQRMVNWNNFSLTNKYVFLSKVVFFNKKKNKKHLVKKFLTRAMHSKITFYSTLNSGNSKEIYFQQFSYFWFASVWFH